MYIFVRSYIHININLYNYGSMNTYSQSSLQFNKHLTNHVLVTELGPRNATGLLDLGTTDIWDLVTLAGRGVGVETIPHIAGFLAAYLTSMH